MYYIIYGFLYLISLLPFFILYGISNFAYFILYNVIGYRTAIVKNNLGIAFPEKSEAERKLIAKQFYKNLTDNFIETIKLLSISKKQFAKRAIINLDAVNAIAAKGKNIQLHSGHQMNWEYTHVAIAKNIKIPWLGVYMRINSKAIDRLFLKIRTSGNAVMIATHEIKTKGHSLFKKQYSIGLIGDQNPGDVSTAYWLNFFGRPTPFVTGPDKGAVINNTAVVFIRMRKIKRGYYIFDAEIITENANELKKGELTLLYRDFLEASIRQQPDNYLWSHRRWKYNWSAAHQRKWIDTAPLPAN
jgi:KDO2-lipid IV(A) lauroyltransferase